MIVFYEPVDGYAIPKIYEAPAVQWMGPFSTGLYRYKRFIFRSEKPTVTVTIPTQEEPVFSLYNPAATRTETYNEETWGSVEDALTDQLVLTGENGWFQMILVAKSDVGGEYITDISIDGILYKFGAGFHGENESLKINLVNKGLEMPDLVGKALYDTDLYEEKPDWVVLNAKYRELLMNYLDLLDNKGSYRSLYNCLHWFDYGGLVDWREIWKYETPDGTKMFDTKVHSHLSNSVKKWLFNSSKTTYMALRHLKKVPRISVGHFGTVEDRIAALETWTNLNFIPPEVVANYFNEWVLEGDLNYKDPYENIEPIPEPEPLPDLPLFIETDYESTTGCRWSEEEMRLKMVLLGNFLETYFMPIHLNLLRSVVEDIEAFSDTLIQHGTIETVQEECYTEAGNFELEWNSGHFPEGTVPEVSEGPTSNLTIQLDEVHVMAGLKRPIPYGQAFENSTVTLTRDTYKGLPYTPMVACHDLDEPSVPMEEDESWEGIQRLMSQQVFHGIGSVAEAIMKFEEPIVAGICETNASGEFIQVHFEEPEPAKEFRVKFLFQRPGHFNMLLRLIGASGRQYSKRVNVEVQNNLRPDLDIRIMTTPYVKYQPGLNGNFLLPDPFHPDAPASAGYLWARTKESGYEVVGNEQTGYQVDLKGDWGYTQYIPIRSDKDGTDLPMDAPFRTPVYTAKFVGVDCLSRMERFIQESLMNQSVPNPGYGGVGLTKDEETISVTFPYRTGKELKFIEVDGVEVVDETYSPTWCWVQYIHPVRGMELARPDTQYGVTEWWTKEIFFPEFMVLTEPGPVVPDCYPVVCVPKFKIYRQNGEDQVVKEVPYSYHVDEPYMTHMWEFYSWAMHKEIGELKEDVVNPFLAWNYSSPLPCGYYTITFRYNFGDGNQELVKHTPFKLINV